MENEEVITKPKRVSMEELMKREQAAASAEQTTEQTQQITEQTQQTTEQSKQTTEQTQQQTEQFSPLKYFGEKFKTTFEKEDDLVSHYNSLSERAAKAEQLEQEFETVKSKSQQLADEAVETFMKETGINDDLLKFFKAQSAFPEVAPDVVSTVLKGDFAETLKNDPLEILVTKERFDHPGLTEEQALRRVYRRYEIDPEVKDDNGSVEIGDDAAVDIKLDAKEAVKEFSKVVSEIKIPERKSITAQKAEQEKLATERYNNIKPLLEKEFKKIPDNLDKVEIFKEKKGKDGKPEKELIFSFSLGDYGKSTHVKKELDQAVDYLSRTLPEYNQELVGKALETSVEGLKAQRILSSLPDMFIAAKEQWKAEWQREHNVEEHNPTGIRTEGAPGAPMTDAEKKRADAQQKLIDKNPSLKEKQIFAR